MNNLTQFNIINLIILAGLAFFALGMSLILMSIYKNRKQPAEVIENFEVLDEPEEIIEEPEEIVEEFEEEIIEEPEEIIEEAEESVEETEEVIEEPEEPEEEIDNTPKARITFAGTNNSDFIMHEFTDSITIGRRDTNDIVISNSAVSGVHCRITFEDGKVYLTDLDSTNGTLVNGEPVVNTEINSGDLIILGQNQYRLTITY